MSSVLDVVTCMTVDAMGVLSDAGRTGCLLCLYIGLGDVQRM